MNSKHISPVTLEHSFLLIHFYFFSAKMESLNFLFFSTLILLSIPGLFANDNSTEEDDFGSSLGDNWFPDNSNDENEENDNSDFDDDSNSTLCSHLSSDDFSTGCQFWMQGVILCCVGFGGVIGNSVSRT